jgi:putative oxidoreductase
MTKKQIAGEIATWVLTLLLVLMFANAGIRKFLENGGWTRLFRNVGFPDWFRIFIGVWETGCAALLLVPRTAAYGAAGIVVVMLGAIVTNAVKGWWQGIISSGIALLVAAMVLAVRWRQRALSASGRRLAPRR